MIAEGVTLRAPAAALVPNPACDRERVGVDVGIVPGDKDRLYGGLSMQCKSKVVE